MGFIDIGYTFSRQQMERRQLEIIERIDAPTVRIDVLRNLRLASVYS